MLLMFLITHAKLGMQPSQHMESSENSANNNNASLDNGSVGEQQLPQHHQQLELPEKSLSETSGIGKQKQKLQHIGGSSKINRFKPNALKVSGNNNKPMIYAGKATRKLQFANSSNDSNITSSSSMSKHTPTQIYEPAISSVGNAFNLNDVSSRTTLNKRQNATSNTTSSNSSSSSNSKTISATTSLASQKYNLPNNICKQMAHTVPKTLTTPTRFVTAKPAIAKPATTTSTTPAAPTTATNCTIPTKRVNFKLPTTITEVEEHEGELDEDNQAAGCSYSSYINNNNNNSNINNNTSMALAAASKLSMRKANKPHIVFNGTYPIDMPLTTTAAHYQKLSRNYDAEANSDRSDMQRYRYMLHDYVIDEDAEGEQAEEEEEDVDVEELLNYADDDDDDEDEEDDDDCELYDDFLLEGQNDFLTKFGILKPKATEEPSSGQNVWSMEELISNPNIPLNYKKMCSEVEQSLSKFEAYLDAKKRGTANTCDINDMSNSVSSCGRGRGTGTGLAKKQL